jgi:aminocarboxymuconate-semialdehyde decarboxylase
VPRVGKFALGQIAHYTYDTTLGVGSLLMSGVLDRFPKLKLLLSHGGGTYPYLAGRFDIMHRRMDKASQGDVAAKQPSDYATQMSYDSIVHAPKTLRFLIEVAGIDNVLLGTDYSFPPADMEPLALLKMAGLSKSDSDAISDGNPRRLFARLK